MDYDKLFTRQNVFYTAHVAQWNRNHAAYSGGKSYIDLALIQHVSEIKEEFEERLKRAYYYNWPRKIARIITQYVLANRPTRDKAIPDYVEDFTRTGLRVDEVMRQFSTCINLYGCAWMCVDMPIITGYVSKADEIRMKLRPYATVISPLDVPDWCYGDDGELLWVITKEHSIDNSDPFKDPVEVDTRKLWTRDKIVIVKKRSDGYEVPPYVAKNEIGVVPFIRSIETDGYAMNAQHWFDDVVRISDAIMNNESEAQMNIVKQMFGLLVVSESFASNAAAVKPTEEDGAGDGSESGATSIASVIGRSAAIIESNEDRGISRYIAPGGAENATIRAENVYLIRMMFDCIGLSATKETKMVESAEAKMWDFQHVEQYMRNRADMLEQCEYRAWELMHMWDDTIPIPTISYNRNFAVLELKDAVATLTELSAFNPDNVEYQQEVSKTAVLLLNRVKQLAQDKQDSIVNGIENSTPITPGASAIMSQLNAGVDNSGNE